MQKYDDVDGTKHRKYNHYDRLIDVEASQGLSKSHLFIVNKGFELF